MENCVFCKMVTGEMPPLKIWENENFLAFLDIHPIQTGHTLIIPKKHTDYVFDIEDAEYCDLMMHAKIVAGILKEKFHSKKVGMIVEGFAISHAHVHLVPINGVNELNPDIARIDVPVEELKELSNKILNGSRTK